MSSLEVTYKVSQFQNSASSARQAHDGRSPTLPEPLGRDPSECFSLGFAESGVISQGADEPAQSSSSGDLQINKLSLHSALDPDSGAPEFGYNTTQHNTTQHNTTQHSTAQHSTAQHNTTQHNTTQHNTTQHNTTQHNTADTATSRARSCDCGCNVTLCLHYRLTELNDNDHICCVILLHRIQQLIYLD